jgi:SP family general alpha glucoside:H+ symporter-like MFS transporter
MISPDQADLGVKAIFVWAGLLVPTIVLLFLYYPEVSQIVVPFWQLDLTLPDLWTNVYRAR